MTNNLQAKLVFPEVNKNISISRKIVTFISRLILCFKKKRSEYQFRRTAIHEAGHAIVGLMTELFDGNPGVIIAIGYVTNDRLRESPPPGKCKHNVLVVFDC